MIINEKKTILADLLFTFGFNANNIHKLLEISCTTSYRLIEKIKCNEESIYNTINLPNDIMCNIKKVCVSFSKSLDGYDIKFMNKAHSIVLQKYIKRNNLLILVDLLFTFGFNASNISKILEKPKSSILNVLEEIKLNKESICNIIEIPENFTSYVIWCFSTRLKITCHK